ncbi:hypothetical protein UlMin_021230 [Ulmus minor]
MWSLLNVDKEPVRVLVTGAAGRIKCIHLYMQIGYAIVPMIARGAMLGLEQPVILYLLDIESAAEALKWVKMELINATFPLFKEACKDVDMAIMVGGFPRKEGMERKDVMSKNVFIYKAQALALEKHAAENCKVLVVANPTNTNALILKEFAPSIPEKYITCPTRLDHFRALGQISERLNVQVSDVRNVIIWSNHSSTQYLDFNHATITANKEKPIRELVKDYHWLNTEFIATVQHNGAPIIKARKQSNALSTTSFACDQIHNWVLGTPKGNWVSMCVCYDGSYEIEASLIYSFHIDEFSRAKMDATAQELIEEKSLA